MTPPRSQAALLVGLVVVLAGCTGIALDAGEVSAPAIHDGEAPEGPTTNGTLAVHFIDVGQANSVFVRGPDDETMLIDTGHHTADGEAVVDYLARRNVTRIDYLVVTHNDVDHNGGNAAVIEYFETEGEGIGAIYDPGIPASTTAYERYMDAVEEYNVTLYRTREGDRIPLDGPEVSVLGPPDPHIEDGERNENSVVLSVTFGSTGFLFPGDAEDDEESHLVRRYEEDLRSTVLQAGHHGSNSSTSGPLLDAVRPRAVVVSSAYDSPFGHPHEGVLQRLATRSVPTYWTGVHGDVVMESDGADIDVRTQAAAPTDPLSLREAGPVPDGVERRPIDRGRLPYPSTTDRVETGIAAMTDGGRRDADPTEGDPSVAQTHEGDRLVVERLAYDAPGRDPENPEGEFVVFANRGLVTLDLSWWTVSEDAGHTYTFPDGYTLYPGETVRLHSGRGPDTGDRLYWGSTDAIWNNDGDTLVVTDDEGDRVLVEGYR